MARLSGSPFPRVCAGLTSWFFTTVLKRATASLPALWVASVASWSSWSFATILVTWRGGGLCNGLAKQGTHTSQVCPGSRSVLALGGRRGTSLELVGGGGDLTGAHWAFLSQSLGNFVTNQHVALATHNTTRLTGLVWLWEAEELGEAATFCLFLAWVWSWAGWSSVGPPSDSDGPWGAEPACNLGHTQHTKAYRGRGGSLAGARWLWLGGGTLLELADCSCNPVAGSVGESGGGDLAGARWLPGWASFRLEGRGPLLLQALLRVLRQLR